MADETAHEANTETPAEPTPETEAPAEAAPEAPEAGTSDASPAPRKKTTKKRSSKKRTKKVAPKSVVAGTSAVETPAAEAAVEEAIEVSGEDAPEPAEASAAASHDDEDAPKNAVHEDDSTQDRPKQDRPKADAGDDDESDDGGPSSRKKKTRRLSTRDEAKPVKRAKKPGVTRRMLINYVPGEECRVAIVDDDQLDEYYSERSASLNRVGNIYLGRVTNVEAAIQAAFVDFGQGENAFLHVTDLHPRYFPSEDGDTVERIGKKIARSQRPPIQRCLKRGQQIVVQVLKDGVGTKGPAVTSYLSIPGRYLVMMPNMDKVGVSRKVDDDDTRKKMKKQLDQLDLPEGFGFILRTAGLDRTKTDLKRDLAYLQRLWKDMEKRQKRAQKPTLLYAESDLLVRSLRDQLSDEIDEIVIDDLAGIKRAANFLKIVSPRTSRNLLHYPESAPIFHAYAIEDQLKMLHQRTVPLPSGGALVIDETEALVAIDVNSGKSRSARDAETNAFETNKEACEVICRQLKLRELGGLVICDLIDMMQSKNRKTIEKQFKDTLAQDKNRATTLPISEFGILEMTRQRSQASHSKIHYHVSPDIKGRALFRKPESLASEALREVAAVASRDKVERVELVVPVKVAGELLTNRRKSISRLERRTGKIADVRVSESFAHDRYVLYAYDGDNNDLEVERLPKIRPPKKLVPWAEVAESEGIDYDWADDPDEAKVDPDAQADADMEKELAEAAHPIERDEADDDDGSGKKKRRRRRRRRGKKAEGEADTEASGGDTEGDESSDERATPASEASDDETPDDDSGDTAEGEASSDSDDPDQPTKKKRRRRRRRRKGSGEGSGEGSAEDSGDAADGADDETSSGSADAGDAADESSEPTGDGTKKKRRRRRRKPSGESGESASSADNKPAAVAEAKPEKKKRRTLYGGSRRKLSASEKSSMSDD
ncbi:MAG: Rne/Rng family ribonuclease [Planctomycetota bacterium]